MDNLYKVSQIIKNSKYLTVFTGAGISKESGIPVFRGNEGVYSKYDPGMLELRTYKKNPHEAWKAVKAIFYDFLQDARPNAAHNILARWEKKGIVKCVITQNIDNLHKDAGSINVVEYHGTKDSFICLNCGKSFKLEEVGISEEYPVCRSCEGLLKPDFIFFGEAIPELAAQISYDEAKRSDVHIVIGTTGDVQPASYIPHYAKKAGATIIEINPEESKFTNSITDIYIKMGASKALEEIDTLLHTFQL
ncbi:MAG: NAD-dependent protein deacylase [Bacteroidales bacterium]|jgi:NAD-dependent deacetylase|nr:NAD-dependent protein deacylase [Bacteroidales bacterium]